MDSRFVGTWTVAVILALVAVVGVASQAAAKEGGDKARHRLVIGGTITDVAAGDESTLITIKRGVDADGADDLVVVSVTDATRVVPRGATPAVDMRAKALVAQPEEEGDPFPALLLVLKVTPQERKRHVCGEISSLPDDPHDGLWTIVVPDVGDFDFIVTPDTRISPKHVEPAVGGLACVYAYSSDDGWVARNIQLRPEPEKSEKGDLRADRRVELHGTVVGDPPGGDPVEWTLTVAVSGGDEHDVLINADTEISGDVEDGARVVVQARVETDSAGDETLIALRVKILPQKGLGRDKDNEHRALHISGEVTAVSDDGSVWTIDPGEGESSIEVTIGEKTKIVGLREGGDPVGEQVDGVVKRQADNTLLATMLRIKKR